MKPGRFIMAGRWVAGLAAAALSVRGLATALVLLRGALIRTGIGAPIIDAASAVGLWEEWLQTCHLLVA